MNDENKIQNLRLTPVNLERLSKLIPIDPTGGARPVLRDAVYYCYKVGIIESPGLIYLPGMGNVSFN